MNIWATSLEPFKAPTPGAARSAPKKSPHGGTSHVSAAPAPSPAAQPKPQAGLSQEPGLSPRGLPTNLRGDSLRERGGTEARGDTNFACTRGVHQSSCVQPKTTAGGEAEGPRRLSSVRQPYGLPCEASPGASVERPRDGAGWDHVQGNPLPLLGAAGTSSASAAQPCLRPAWILGHPFQNKSAQGGGGGGNGTGVPLPRVLAVSHAALGVVAGQTDGREGENH